MQLAGGGGRRWSNHRGGRGLGSRWGGLEDGDLELHAALAVLVDAAEEPPAFGLVEHDPVLAGGQDDGVVRLVANAEVRPAHLHHIVDGWPVHEHCDRYNLARERQAISLVSRGREDEAIKRERGRNVSVSGYASYLACRRPRTAWSQPIACS